MKQAAHPLSVLPRLSRRSFLGALGAYAALPAQTLAQAPGREVLPLNTPGLDHLDIIVPDVAASARFYMQLFNTRLHAQPFRGGQRYFVLLEELPQNRQVGYLAIGASEGRGSYIGHYCTSVFDYRRDSEAITAAMTDAFAEAGLGEFPGTSGIGGIFADPDGIEIQFLPAPDTLVGAATPSDLVEPGQGLLSPRGLDHALLRVSDLDQATRYYRILYGRESRHQHNPDRVWFEFDDATALILEQTPYGYGSPPAIAHFCIRVAPFDRSQAIDTLAALNAQILPAPQEPGVLRFRDLDGIIVEVKAVEA